MFQAIFSGNYRHATLFPHSDGIVLISFFDYYRLLFMTDRLYGTVFKFNFHPLP